MPPHDPAANHHGTPVTQAISAVTTALGSVAAIVTATLLAVIWVVGGFFVSRHFANATYSSWSTARPASLPS